MICRRSLLLLARHAAACWWTGNSSGYQRIIGTHFLCKGICSLLRRQQLARHSRMLGAEMGRRGMPDCSVSRACVVLNVSLYFNGLLTAEMRAARNAQMFRACMTMPAIPHYEGRKEIIWRTRIGPFCAAFTARTGGFTCNLSTTCRFTITHR